MSPRQIRMRSVVTEHQSGKRLDAYLHTLHYTELEKDFSPSRSYLQKWIFEGFVSVNDVHCIDKSRHVKTGDVISIDAIIEDYPEIPPPEPLDIQIVYRDDFIVVIDKPPGISSHPVPYKLRGTVVNFLKSEGIKLPLSSHPLRPGIVHRLDKNTSGLMVIACTDKGMSTLIEMIKNREVFQNRRGQI